MTSPTTPPSVNMQAFRPLAEACHEAVQALHKAIHSAAKHQRENNAAREEVYGHLAVINALREQIRLKFPGAPGVVGCRAWSHPKDYSGHGSKYAPIDGDIRLDQPEAVDNSSTFRIASLDLSAEEKAALMRPDCQVIIHTETKDETAQADRLMNRLYTEKASEVRTLLTELYDRFVDNKPSSVVPISFGTLCDVMNLLEPLPSGYDSGAAAARTLLGMGWSHEGGEQWRPPFGKSPLFAKLVPTVEDIVAGIKRRIDTIEAKGEGQQALAELSDAINAALTEAGSDPLDEDVQGTLEDLRPLIEYPARRLTLTFTHPSIGDALFTPLLLQSMRELIEYMGEVELNIQNRPGINTADRRYPFTASNGIVVDVLAWKTVDEQGDREDAAIRPIEPANDPASKRAEAVMREAAQAVEDMAGMGRAVIEQRPDMLDACQALDIKPGDVKFFHAESTQAEQLKAAPLIKGELGVVDSDIRIVRESKRYTFDEFLEYGRDYCRRHEKSLRLNIPWSFRFHGWPVTHERDGLYLIGDSLTTHHFNEADEISVLSDGTFRIHSAALETLGEPSGNRRVFKQGDIVKMEGGEVGALYEVEGYDVVRDLVTVRVYGSSCTLAWVKPSRLELAPMAEATKKLLNVIAAEEVSGKSLLNKAEDKAVGGRRNHGFEGKFSDETLKQRAERLTAFGWSAAHIEETEGYLNVNGDVAYPKVKAPPPQAVGAMTPTIGRRVWFRPDPRTGSSNFIVIDHSQPLDAGIVWVWSETRVNLDVTDHHGNHHAMSSVYLVRPGEPPPPDGAYAEWMPFQIKQAGKA